MATTKIVSIRVTEANAIAYIANPDKTNNGELIFTNGCSKNPYEASKDFEQIRSLGTGRNQILSHHFIQSFSPGEITPESALQVGIELCREFLGNEYQYYLAVHNDKEHIHLHCIFNNVNMIDGRTFETHADQGDKQHRKWVNLRNLSDEICKRHCLSVIENPENNKGKTYYEWDMSRQGLSWKAKLKFTIDQVVKESNDFEDFLRKCTNHNIEVVYSPEHVIDLKFKLTGQKKFTRARTLGWYYETKQIIKRIELYNGIIRSHAKSNLIDTQTEKMQNSSALQHWAEIENMKRTAKALNQLTEYTEKDRESIEKKLFAAHTQIGFWVDKLNSLKTEIDDLDIKIKTARKVQKLKPVMDKLKTLSGHKKKRFESEHQAEISDYRKSVKQLKEMFPSGNVQTPETMEKKRNALAKERSLKHDEYLALKAKVSELEKSRKTVDDYLRNQKNMQKKRKKDDLE